MAHDDDIRFAHVLADDSDAQTMARYRDMVWASRPRPTRDRKSVV